jgi:cytochrome c-type biogenesis protein
MEAVALVFFAGILTVAAPCSLPVLPALLGVSLAQRDRARPAFITMGFVVSFTAAAVFFSVTTQIAGIDQTALRTAAAVLLATFGALMLWPRPFEWFWVRIGARLMPGDRMVMRFAQGNLGAAKRACSPRRPTRRLKILVGKSPFWYRKLRPIWFGSM